MRMFRISSCWMWNPWKSLNASGQSFQQPESWTSASLWTLFYIWYAVNFSVWFTAFTDTNKGLLACIQDSVQGATSEIPCECCCDFIAEQSRIEAVMFSKYPNGWDQALAETMECFQEYRRPGMLDSWILGSLFRLSLYRHGLLPHIITTNRWPFLCHLPVINFRSFSTFEEGVMTVDWHKKILYVMEHWSLCFC